MPGQETSEMPDKQQKPILTRGICYEMTRTKDQNQP